MQKADDKGIEDIEVEPLRARAECVLKVNLLDGSSKCQNCTIRILVKTRKKKKKKKRAAPYLPQRAGSSDVIDRYWKALMGRRPLNDLNKSAICMSPFQFHLIEWIAPRSCFPLCMSRGNPSKYFRAGVFLEYDSWAPCGISTSFTVQDSVLHSHSGEIRLATSL
jgi:DNA-directed RNA polymerase subunit RPC12/RpoP